MSYVLKKPQKRNHLKSFQKLFRKRIRKGHYHHHHHHHQPLTTKSIKSLLINHHFHQYRSKSSLSHQFWKENVSKEIVSDRIVHHQSINQSPSPLDSSKIQKSFEKNLKKKKIRNLPAPVKSWNLKWKSCENPIWNAPIIDLHNITLETSASSIIYIIVWYIHKYCHIEILSNSNLYLILFLGIFLCVFCIKFKTIANKNKKKQLQIYMHRLYTL